MIPHGAEDIAIEQLKEILDFTKLEEKLLVSSKTFKTDKSEPAFFRL